MKDLIQKSIQIHASKEAIYKSLSDPDELVKWFADSVEGNLKPGNQPVFGFGEYGKSRVYIQEARPHEYFAFRWIPGNSGLVENVLEETTTLVEFRITEGESGVCTVILTESGFASLPAELMKESYGINNESWAFMMDRFIDLYAA